MSNDPVRPGTGADDLLGRWFAHHEQAAADDQATAADDPADPVDGAAGPPRHIPLAARPSEAAASRLTRPSASAVLAELQSTPPAGPRDGARDRTSPVGFEPVILRSVRKKTESQEQEKKGSRLSRLRSRVAGPVEDPVEDPGSDEQDRSVETYDEPTALVPPPTVETPVPAPVAAPTAVPEPPAPPRKTLPFEDVIALATQASPPAAEPEPVQPDPEPVQPDPEPEPEPDPEVDPALPSSDTEPPPVPRDDTPKRRLVTRTRRPDDDGPERRRRPADTPRHASAPTTGTGGAARGLLAAARPVPVPVPVPAPVPVAAVPTPAHAPAPAPAPADETLVDAPPPAPAMEMPAIYQFAPLKSARRFLSLMFVTGLAISGYLGYLAYQSRETMDIGIAAIVTLVTLVIWAIRAGATVTRLTVRRGQLEIARQGGRVVFDLASTYTSIEVVGRPGSKKWKVLFHRRGMSPVVVDASMVDPRDFMRVLRFFRPDLGPRSTPDSAS